MTTQNSVPQGTSQLANGNFGPFRRAARWLVLPTLLGGGLFATWYGFARLGIAPIAAATLSILVFAFLGVGLAERFLPYRKDWLRSHGDIWTDITYLLVNNGIVERVLVATLTVLFAGISYRFVQQYGITLWPHHWPILAQFVLMAVVAEFGSYWYHYLAHTRQWMWRLHAIHHSAPRLYFLNAPRFHPLDRIISNLPESLPFIILGTNEQTIALFATYNAIVGLLQHCNVDLRLGVLNYVFSLSELHRWHHSKRIEESDTNFGSNLIIWDLVFGTYFNPKDRHVDEIGLLNPDYPRGFLGQCAAPFHKGDISKPADYGHYHGD